MVEATTATQRPTGGTRRRAEAWTWFATVTGAMFLVGAARPLGDPDIWWHVRVGQLILDSGIPREEPWAFTAQGRDWVPTAWLSDVALAVTHDTFGWRGIVALKLVLSLALLGVVAAQLFAVASPRVAAPLFALTAITLSPFLAERPQLASLLLTAWLTSRVRRSIEGELTPWWTLAVAYVWANLHGMWVLFPIAMVLLSLGLLLDRTEKARQRSARAAMLGAGSIVAAALTPVGPKLAYWPLVVRDAASDISEWQPTVLANRYSLAFTLLFLLWVVAVARNTQPAGRAEILWMLATLLFSLQAGRNVAPAIVMMAPFVGSALQRAYGARLDSLHAPKVPVVLPIATVATAIVAAVGLVLVRDPLVDGIPLRIVEVLKQQPGTVRVLNSYNVGGVLTGFGAPEISVAIDGRTDNFDPTFVHRYLAATTKLVDWRRVVRSVNADYAVVGNNGTLATELHRAGWVTVMVDGDFALLKPPEQPV